MTPQVAVLALGIALAVPLQAGAPLVGEPRVLADLGGYTSCVFAADGSAIICSRVNEQELSEELWRVELQSGEAELIGYGRQPAVRGTLLAYVGTEPDREGIWLRDLEGEDAERLVPGSAGYDWPTISLDAQTIACCQLADTRGGVFQFRPQGEQNRWLSRQGEGEPAYSADGSRMLVTRGKQIWLMSDVGVGEEISAQRLTDGGREKVDPSWGPGDAWVTFVARWNERTSNIGLLHLASGELTWLAEDLTGARSPVISPAGDKLVYVAAHGDDNAVHVRDLHLP